jgi:hypothetical protein
MGPFCRAAADCATIIDVLRGRDAADPGSRDLPLGDPFAVNISALTLGVLPSVQGSSAEVRPAAAPFCPAFPSHAPCRTLNTVSQQALEMCTSGSSACIAFDDDARQRACCLRMHAGACAFRVRE